MGAVLIARDGLPPDSPDLELLDELDSGAREAVAELRNLAHGIYPPLLRDAGLTAALRAVAGRSPVAVMVVDDRPERAADQREEGRGLGAGPRDQRRVDARYERRPDRRP